MLPFRVQIRPGSPIHEQVVYAAKKALISGRFAIGESFPSVRVLSRELRINPNTAHKVIAALISDGLLESMPGVGTVVALPAKATASQTTALLGREMEQLVVEAKKLGVSLNEFKSALDSHWHRIGSPVNDEGDKRR